MQSEVIISDLSVTKDSGAVSDTPAPGKWLLIPYEGKEISGQMLWSPEGNNPPDLSIPLPKVGPCKIHIGIFASGTWPWYFNLIGMYGQRQNWVRLMLKLSDQDFFDEMVPENHPEQQRLGYVTETFWKTANLTGQSLVIAPPRKESYVGRTSTFLAHVRIVPDSKGEDWPKSTKRLVQYFDSNYFGHYVDSVEDIKSMLVPLRDSDVKTIFWTSCREDSCYYPTKVGNVLPNDTMRGVYPYFAGPDLHRMLARGEDPMKAVCDVGHECGLEVFASYRRMTCRMPPFVFPIHRDGLFMKRKDLWCADQQGKPVPHLSMAYPEVRRRIIDLQIEQATNYNIDGVHFYFSRSVPFIYFEKPFLDAFQREHAADARILPQTDERIWQTRASFFILFLRELRQAMDAVGKKRRRPIKIAMHAQNSVRNCLFYGVDIAQIAKEGLLDIFLPDGGHFLPPEMGAKDISADAVKEFLALARGTGMKIIPHLPGLGKGPVSQLDLAQQFFAVGADGLHPSHCDPYNATWQIQRRFGHIDEIASLNDRKKEWERIVRFQTMAGMTFDLQTGIATCG